MKLSSFLKHEMFQERTTAERLAAAHPHIKLFNRSLCSVNIQLLSEKDQNMLMVNSEEIDPEVVADGIHMIIYGYPDNSAIKIIKRYPK